MCLDNFGNFDFKFKLLKKIWNFYDIENTPEPLLYSNHVPETTV